MMMSSHDSSQNCKHSAMNSKEGGGNFLRLIFTWFKKNQRPENRRIKNCNQPWFRQWKSKAGNWGRNVRQLPNFLLVDFPWFNKKVKSTEIKDRAAAYRISWFKENQRAGNRRIKKCNQPWFRPRKSRAGNWSRNVRQLPNFPLVDFSWFNKNVKSTEIKDGASAYRIPWFKKNQWAEIGGSRKNQQQENTPLLWVHSTMT